MPLHTVSSDSLASDQPTTPGVNPTQFSRYRPRSTNCAAPTRSRSFSRSAHLQRKIGCVSQKVLTQTLRDLEGNGFVHREVFPVVHRGSSTR